MDDRLLVDEALAALGNLLRHRGIGPRQQDDELLTAKARDQVAWLCQPSGLGNTSGDLIQPIDGKRLAAPS